MTAVERVRPPYFSCDVRSVGETITVRLKGELDMVTCREADDVLASAVDGGGRRLVLDLRELTFMDSSGLRLLLRWDDRSRRSGLRMEVVRGPEHVQRLLELTGLQDHFAYADG